MRKTPCAAARRCALRLPGFVAGMGLFRLNSGRETECCIRSLKSDNRSVLLGPVTFCGPPGTRLSGYPLDSGGATTLGVTVIVRSMTPGHKHSSRVFQILENFGILGKLLGRWETTTGILQILTHSNNRSPLPQFDSRDLSPRVALVYFASLLIRACEQLPRDSGNETRFSFPQTYAYQTVARSC